MVATDPPLDKVSDVQRVRRHFDECDIESLIALYAEDAVLEVNSRDGPLRFRGPIPLRDGLQRVGTRELDHDILLASTAYGGVVAVQRCRDHTGSTVAWGTLTIRDGQIVRHEVRFDRQHLP
jgi:SnoaL-like domain